ncbi:MAG: PAS domain S-box protein, partial [Deltaproteobacteria bacterium]|nr:PAS domain S-box protein [Deltaproteobacteria bacterium]
MLEPRGAKVRRERPHQGRRRAHWAKRRPAVGERSWALRERIAELEAERDRLRASLRRAQREREELSGNLEERERRYRAIFDRTFQFIGLITADGTVIEANRTALDAIGAGLDEVTGRPFWETPWWAHSAAEQAKLRAAVEAAARGEFVRFETSHPSSEGGLIHVDFSLKPIRDDKGAVVFIIPEGRDITDRKRVEEALRESEALRQSEARFRELADLLPETVFETNVKGIITFLNKKGLELLRRTPEEVARGIRGRDLLSPSEWLRARQNAERVLRGETVGVQPYTAVDKEGTPFPVLVHSMVVRRRDEVTGFRGVMVDMSELHKAERERIRLATAVEQAGEAVVICDSEGVIEYVNPAFEKITGYSRAEAVGRDVMFPKVEEGEPEAFHGLKDALARKNSWAGRLVGRRKDGAPYEEECTVSPVRERSGDVTHYVAVCRDVTERSRLERQFRQAQKLEALGTLAGGIAHDFNNVLMPIIGYTQLTLDDLPDEGEATENLERVLSAAERARDLIGQILAFSREVEQPRRPVRIAPLVKETLKLMAASLPKTVEIVGRIETEDDFVLADPIRIHQVLVNLCTNAGLAMEGRPGVLEVALGDAHADSAELARYLEVREGPYLKLRVADSGCGMTADVLERAFEPFFTTRAGRGGTGLGLAAVHGIVKGLGGAVRVYSEPDRGTEFHVYLPKAKGAEEPTSGPEAEVPRGTERVLLVDDEEAIVELGRKILEDLGYRVVGTTSSPEAFRLFRNGPDDFDVVVTDQTMPVMTGRSLIQRIRRVRKKIPVILMTGFSRAVSEREAQALRDVLILSKPV